MMWLAQPSLFPSRLQLDVGTTTTTTFYSLQLHTFLSGEKHRFAQLMHAVS
jgi:hypothetical protein